MQHGAWLCYFRARSPPSPSPDDLTGRVAYSKVSGRLFFNCVPLPEASAGVPIGIRRLNECSQSTYPERSYTP